jgi:hypothetical protein
LNLLVCSYTSGGALSEDGGDTTPEHVWVTDQDRKDFVLAMEIDTNKKSKHFGLDQLVAQSVTVRINHIDRVVELNTLVLDHLRRLCKNLGMRHVGSLSKFEIRKSIATYFDGMDNMEKNGISPTTVASRRTSTILRLVNVIFGERFIEDFLKVNNAKSRQDHETFRTHKDFWMRATIAHNSCIESENDIVVSPPRQQEHLHESDAGTRYPEDVVADVVALPISTNHIVHLPFNPTAACHSHIGSKEGDYDSANSDGELPDASSIPCQTAGADSEEEEYDSCQANTGNDASSSFRSSPPAAGDEFSRLVIPDNDEFLSALIIDKSINLSLVNQFETQASRSKVLMLFKMRQTIQQNMSVSGTHNHVVWDFLVEGALQKRGSSGVAKIALHYFYMQCEQITDIDAHFQPFMDACMIGATNAPLKKDKDIGGAGTSQSIVCALSLSGGSRKTPRRNNPGEEEGASFSAVVAYLE